MGGIIIKVYKDMEMRKANMIDSNKCEQEKG